MLRCILSPNPVGFNLPIMLPNILPVTYVDLGRVRGRVVVVVDVAAGGDELSCGLACARQVRGKAVLVTPPAVTKSEAKSAAINLSKAVPL